MAVLESAPWPSLSPATELTLHFESVAGAKEEEELFWPVDYPNWRPRAVATMRHWSIALAKASGEIVWLASLIAFLGSG